jgi:hypothetical protein
MEYKPSIGYIVELHLNNKTKLANDLIKEHNFIVKDLIDYCKKLDVVNSKILELVAEIFI